MRHFTVIGLVLLFALSSCAAVELKKQTASGHPERVFRDCTNEEAQSKLVAACSDRGLIVYSSTPSQVICGKVLEGGNAVLAGLIVGNRYSTPPEQKIRFTIYKVSDGYKVVAHQWIESQLPGGQIRQQPLISNAQKNDVQDFLESLGSL